MKEKGKFVKVYGSGLLFSLIVGFSFIAIKMSIKDYNPLMILTYRFNFAVIASLIIITARLSRIDIKGKPKKKLILTAVFYVSFMVLQTAGLVFSTTVESGIIFAIIPIIARIIAGVLLKEHTSWKQNIFICLSVAAVITMIVLGATDITVNLVGLIVLTLSSVSMAISNVMMRYTRQIYTPFENAAVISLVGCFVFNLATIIFGIKDGTLSGYFEPLFDLNFLFAAIYLGVLSTLFTMLTMAYMMKHMEAVKATIFGNLSTAISIVAGVLVMSEPLQVYHIICTILIIAGVIGLSIQSMPKQQVAEAEKQELIDKGQE